MSGEDGGRLKAGWCGSKSFKLAWLLPWEDNYLHNDGCLAENLLRPLFEELNMFKARVLRVNDRFVALVSPMGARLLKELAPESAITKRIDDPKSGHMSVVEARELLDELKMARDRLLQSSSLSDTDRSCRRFAKALVSALETALSR